MLVVIGIVVGVLAASAIAWVTSSRSSTYDRSGDGCVNVSIPSSMGGGLEHQCGGAAREWCRSAYSQRNAHAEAVQAQCRIAGIPR